MERGVQVAVTGSVQLCRDPDDDVVLETALKGSADMVVSRDEDVTGDEELVSLLRLANIRVVTVNAFLGSLDELDV